MGTLIKTALIAMPIVFFALGVVLFVQNSRVPGNLGVREGRLAPLPASPNAVSSQAIQAEQRVAPLPFQGDLQETRATLISAIERYPGRVQIVAGKERYIHCVFSTTMGFNDDVEFFLDAENKVVHFRSASRIGYSDLGLNRKRYTILAALYSPSR